MTSERPRCSQRSVLGSTVIVKSLFGDKSFGSLNTLLSTPALVSEIAGDSASGPIRTLACDDGSAGFCADARAATRDRRAIRKSLRVTQAHHSERRHATWKM